MKIDTTERKIIREDHCANLAFDECDKYGMWPEGVSARDAERIFRIGFRMGFRHPNGDRDTDRPSQADESHEWTD